MFCFLFKSCFNTIKCNKSLTYPKLWVSLLFAFRNVFLWGGKYQCKTCSPVFWLYSFICWYSQELQNLIIWVWDLVFPLWYWRQICVFIYIAICSLEGAKWIWYQFIVCVESTESQESEKLIFLHSFYFWNHGLFFRTQVANFVFG